jgi:hypothetical protein
MHNFYPEDPFYQTPPGTLFYPNFNRALKKMVDSPAAPCYTVPGEPEMARDERKKSHADSKQQGIDAERYFSKHLDERHIPFYHIDSSKETRSQEFKDKNIRRPDYIIHTKKGVFHVDVKYRRKRECHEKNGRRFYLGQDEIVELFNFEDEMRLPVWIAFTENDENRTFCYASISQIYSYYNTIVDLYEKKYDEAYRTLSRGGYYFIHVPADLLYHCLSFDRSFYTEHDQLFYEEETEYHRIVHKEEQEENQKKEQKEREEKQEASK